MADEVDVEEGRRLLRIWRAWPKAAGPLTDLAAWLVENADPLLAAASSPPAQVEGAAEDVVRLREALEAARSFASEVAGDDCPHAAAATRELHRIAAALAGPEVVDASMAGPKWVEAVTPPPVPDQTGSGG